jgi:predicted acylesterase/phospholipase RssA
MSPPLTSDHASIERAAVSGDTAAMFKLGAMYLTGEHVPQDHEQARHWFEKAATAGRAEAMYGLGLLYRNGNFGWVPDVEKARYWLEKGAAAGHADAMYDLGLLYRNGKGVVQNYAEARRWYEGAAVAGSVKAMALLGAMYADGYNVPRNMERARRWDEMAASSGDADALLSTGAMWMSGEAGSQDLGKAQFWFEKAAAAGSEEARVVLRKFDQLLTDPPLSKMIMAITERRIRWVGAWIVAGILAVSAYFDLAEIPAEFYVIDLTTTAVLMYICFASQGLFSFLDLIGWLSTSIRRGESLNAASNPNLRLIRLLPDLNNGEPRPAKTGLVLAGGGGKGAYQIGCWKALQRRGFHVDALAGTSIGALNVAMMVRGDAKRAASLWQNLSASQIMRLDVPALPFLPLIFERYRRRYVYDRPLTTIVSCGLSIVCASALAWLLWEYWLMRPPRKMPSWVSYLYLGFPFLFGLLFFVDMALKTYNMLSARRDKFLVQPSLFGTDQLRGLIKELVPAGLFLRSPLAAYVTVAVETRIFDPLDPNHERAVRTSFMGKKLPKLVPRLTYQPLYQALADVESSGGINWVYDLLMWSSTLPIVFPARRLNGAWIVDGGLADNLPIRPLLQHGCTRILVIHLNATGLDVVDGRSFNVLTKEGLLQKLEWQERLESLGKHYRRIEASIAPLGWGELNSALSGDPVLDPSRKIPLTAEVIHVVPSGPLGSFITGTLNFTGKNARWLMQLGERDMNEVLDELYRVTTAD